MQDARTIAGLGSEDDEPDAQEVGRATAAWDKEYEGDKSWEALEEDEFGRLKAPDQTAALRDRRERLRSAALGARLRRGLIRYCVLVVDLSASATETDFRPSRLGLLGLLLPSFVRSFFGANPLSQLGLTVARDGLAHRISELSGSPEAHCAAIARLLAKPGGCSGGQLSLQNALDQAVASLQHVPPYGSREVLLVQNALSSCDPVRSPSPLSLLFTHARRLLLHQGNIHKSVEDARAARVRCSVVAFGGEVHVARRLTELTGGMYGVALSESHAEELLLAHAPPPPALEGSAASSLVQMGFPQRAPLQAEGDEAEAGGGTFFCAGEAGAFACPRCRGRVAELPSACPLCRLTLISSPHLARSYHHLFPVQLFEETILGAFEGGACHGCAAPFEGVKLTCPRCAQHFCFHCDSHIHESLHVCPGCEGLPESCRA